jgi:hypothetical protein
VASVSPSPRRCLSALERRACRTHGRLNGFRPDAAAPEVLPGYTHMDVFFGRDAPRDVFPRIVAALAR